MPAKRGRSRTRRPRSGTRRYTRSRSIGYYVRSKFSGKRYGFQGPKARTLQFGTGFGTTLHAKLKYTQNFTLTINTGTSGSAFGNVATQTFQSSLYDPDFTGTGHQPIYFDTLTPNVYGYYRVYGIAYTIMAMNTNTTQMMPVCIEYSSYSTPKTVSTPADWQTLTEIPGMRKYQINPAGMGPRYMKGYMSVAKTLGVPGAAVRTDDRFRALYNSNPADMAYIHFYVTSGNVSASNICQLQVQLTYYCEFEGLKEPAGS